MVTGRDPERGKSTWSLPRVRRGHTSNRRSQRSCLSLLRRWGLSYLLCLGASPKFYLKVKQHQDLCRVRSGRSLPFRVAAFALGRSRNTLAGRWRELLQTDHLNGALKIACADLERHVSPSGHTRSTTQLRRVSKAAKTFGVLVKTCKPFGTYTN